MSGRILVFLFSVVILGGLTLIALAGQTSSVKEGEEIAISPTDWPWWRGPQRNGVANANQKPPLHWSESENIVWKTPVPGRGHGSPILLEKQIFLATADEAEQIQSVMSFNRDTGKILWKKDIHVGGFDKKGNKRSSQASCTPACDGQRLFVNFNHNKAIYTTALDLKGKQLWQTKICDYTTHQGYGSSPAVYGNLVLVNADNKGGGVLAALDRQTGKIVWKHNRPKTANYASPIILKVAGRDQLILSGCNLVASYNPSTGKKLWEMEGSTTECVTSTVTDGDIIITSGGYPRNHIAAVKADGSTKILWDNNTRCYVPSMILHNHYLYTVTDNGIALCTDVKTGKEVWKSRLGGTFNASLVLVGDLLFGTNEDGQTFIFKTNPKKFELVATNQLGRDIFATPTICGGRIYMRIVGEGDRDRQEYLVCLGKKETTH